MFSQDYLFFETIIFLFDFFKTVNFNLAEDIILKIYLLATSFVSIFTGEASKFTFDLFLTTREKN